MSENKEKSQKNNEIQQNKKAPIPKKSSSIIVCRKKSEQQNQFNYEFLMLRRNPKLPFGGMHSYPGGNMDKEDSIFTQKRKPNSYKSSQIVYDWQDTLIYTGVRELFEEIGVILAQRNQEQKIVELAQAEKLQFEDIFQATQPDLRKICKPFMRIITIQSMPRRWDTQFFLVEVEEDGSKLSGDSYCIFNVLKFQKTKKIEDLYDTDDLVLGQDESDDFSWENPQTALQKHFQNKIKLPIPQQLICNLMLSFQTTEQIKQFFSQIDEQSKKQDIESQVDYLRKYPLTFPTILEIKRNQKKSQMTMCGDEDYPIQTILEREEESPFKQELSQAYKSVRINKGQKMQIISDFQTELQTNIKCDFLSPLNLLRTLDLKNFTTQIETQPKL
ncbi:NUDIX hydrolase (macronuclear) [Tetrahymena thermophila SB210]|uniref:NUDIX hydrolase n=1 Tax=Tetrahymena thermophila (strain SB210) TaxID=312017 RepID=Q22CN4_TETTS|nr:NUDIX hydrolase [Tetrahymena thermophila SB210]EAR83081.1 NUDIX hydrolase [Tetrahymena thermophila SB210]|eukprot:XP_001030744.1 NUDIX hydrolase [Tetrahymena thermophila SB210]